MHSCQIINTLSFHKHFIVQVNTDAMLSFIKFKTGKKGKIPNLNKSHKFLLHVQHNVK